MTNTRNASPELGPDGSPQHGLKSLPFGVQYPIIASAVAGLLLRLVFWGASGSNWSPMAGAFIFCAPIIVGMVMVYCAERIKRRHWGYYFYAPFLATCLFIGGTLILMIEGWICAIVIVPMFAVLGGVGGVAMGILCRLTNWPQPTIYGVAALPISLAALAGNHSGSTDFGHVERTQRIEAPAAVVWQQLNSIDNITSNEMQDSLAVKIGVPPPLAGATRETPQGRVRESRWGKDVHFEEVIADWDPERYLRWTYRFAPDSFPKHALDDHVLIGGHYFDLLETSYTLNAEGDTTQLTTKTRYRISTQFNFYAEWVAQLVLGSQTETGLRLYAARSETAWKNASKGGAKS